jgi:hypothetical protein
MGTAKKSPEGQKAQNTFVFGGTNNSPHAEDERAERQNVFSPRLRLLIIWHSRRSGRYRLG